MTSPRVVKKQPSSSSNYYFVLFVKILLVILILLWLPQLVTGKKRRRRKQIKTINQHSHRNRLECETECLELIPEEAMNCVHQCLSSECFSKIYGSELLEPGEIDWERATEMDKCVKEEIAEERRKKRREKI